MTLEQDVRDIQQRNRRVESEKAWERSLTRRLAITIFTFVLAFVWLKAIGNSNPALTALIPAGGYFLSTLTLPFVKTEWEKHQK